MKKVMTVAGEIDSAQLGVTDLHEHTFLDLKIAGSFLKNYFKNIPQSMLEFLPENFAFLKNGVYLVSDECAVIDDMEFLEKEYGFLKRDGVQTVVDCSPIGGRGDVLKIKELSERTGLQIVVATGLYTETSRPAALAGKTADEYYTVIKQEVEEGIDGTGIKPGILKSGIATIGPDGKLAQGEVAGVMATARLSGETGLSVHIHTDPNVPGQYVLDTAKLAIAQGASPDKVHICHMDNRIACGVPVKDYLTKPEVCRTLDLTVQKQLLDLGVTIGLDTWGMPITNPQFFLADNFERLKALITLIDAGYEDQITIGCDFSSKIMGRTYGNYGCTRFMEFAVPKLQELGYQSALQKILVTNPARILAT